LTVAEREPLIHVGKGKRQTATCMNALHCEAAVSWILRPRRRSKKASPLSIHRICFLCRIK